MARLVFVIAAVVVVAISTLTHQYGYALAAGVVAGTVLFFAGVASGGAIGNTRSIGTKPSDFSVRIGVLLAASGIASQSIGHQPPYPLPFQIFYGACLVVACLAAVGLAAIGIRRQTGSK